MKFGGKPIIKKAKPTHTQKKKAHAAWQTKAKKTVHRAQRRSGQPKYVANTKMKAELVLKLQTLSGLILSIGVIFIIISFFVLAHYREINDQTNSSKWSYIVAYGIGFVMFYPFIMAAIFSLKPKRS